MAGAIVHEWIERSGGAEKVLDAFVNLYPDSDIYALWNDAPERYPESRVFESWLSRTPARRHKAASVPLVLPTWRTLRARAEYEWLLVSSHFFAHHARFLGRHVPKFVYAHTPARAIWVPELDPRGNSWAARKSSKLLRPIDRRLAGEAISIAVNSEFVRDRTAKAWGREATVIYPPVDVNRIANEQSWEDRLGTNDHLRVNTLPNEFILGASRFVSYKRLDAVIEAGEHLSIPVVIAGRGPELATLRAKAADVKIPVTFIVSPSDELLFTLYQRAIAYIFPAIEDFGIMPVEAMAAGARVVTLNAGGASESVVDGESGSWARSPSAEDLSDAVERVQSIERSTARCRAFKFDSPLFQINIQRWMSQ